MSEAITAKLRGSVYFSPALQPHFMCIKLNSKATVLVWRCKPLGLEKLVRRAYFQNIRSGDSPYYAVGDALWRLERTRSRSDFLKLLKPNGHGLTRIMPAPEQPCSPVSSHGRLRFGPVIVTTARAQSSLSSPFSVLVGMKLIFTPWTVLVGVTTYVHPVYILKSRKCLASDICSDWGRGGGGLHQSYHCSDFQKCPIIEDHPKRIFCKMPKVT